MAKILATELDRLIKKVGIYKDDPVEEITYNHNRVIHHLNQTKLKQNIDQFVRETGRRISKKSIRLNAEIFWSQVVANSFQSQQTASGELFRRCVTRILGRKDVNIPYAEEQERPDVSSEAIDLVLFPGTGHEVYWELKWSLRERKAQVSDAYTGKCAVFLLTRDTKDLTQNKVDKLLQNVVYCVPLINVAGKRKGELQRVVTLQGAITLAYQVSGRGNWPTN